DDEPGFAHKRGDVDARDEMAGANPFPDMGGDPLDEEDLLSGKRSTDLAMNAHVAPAHAAAPKHCPQLVAETKRPEDVPVAWTRVWIAGGRFDERPHADAVPSERRPLVHVVVDELVGNEIRNRACRNLLLLRLGEEKRCRIDGRPESCVERHHPPEPWEHALPELRGQQTGPAEVDDRPGDVLEGRPLLHWNEHVTTPRSSRQIDDGSTFAITSYRPRATSSTPVAATVLARLFSAFASVTIAASSLFHRVRVKPVASSRSRRNTAPALPGSPATNGLTCLFTCSAHRASPSGEPFQIDVLATITSSIARRGPLLRTPI